MIRLVQRKLIIPRGDTGTFSVPVLPNMETTGNVAVFTIFDPKTLGKIYQKIIETNSEIITIDLEHNDTVNLPVGNYLWDIKFYKDPVFADENLINGVEVDSYYAAYRLPECEVRLTGDNLLTANDAPNTTLTPSQLNIINAALTEIQGAKTEVAHNAETAASVVETVVAAKNAATNKAGEAAASATAAENAQSLAEAAQRAAASSADSAAAASNEIKNLTVETSTLEEGSNATASYSSATGVMSLGIPRGDTGNGIASVVQNNDTSLTITYTNGNSVTTVPLKGEQGDAFHIVKTYESVAAMNADYNGNSVQVGEFVMIASNVDDPDNARVYVKGNQQYNFIVDMSGSAGIQGPQGNTPSISIGTVSTLIAGSNATATITGTTTNPVLNLGIPRGAIGNTGVGIENIAKTETNGLVDTYTITLSSGATKTFTVTNGSRITGMQKTGTSGLVDTYTVSFSDGTNGTFTVTNGTIPNFTIGTVTTGAQASATITGTTDAPVLNLVLPQGEGVPSGGATGQVLKKKSGTDYDTEWGNEPSVPVTDVQVNGTSILNNGVANVPIAGTNAGVVKINASDGVSISNGGLFINGAVSNNIKGGTNNYRPIVPACQHESTFYGLAKAAGDTSQSQSNNAVGAYTDAAKSAIQSMLGVDNLIAPRETSYVAQRAYAIGDLFMLDGKLYHTTAAIAQDGAIMEGTNCEAVKLSEVVPHDVQVNGTSVVTNGVANVPVADSNTYGVVTVNKYIANQINEGGVYILNGKLYVVGANDIRIKSGTDYTAPVCAGAQHKATFYGLAKASGDTTQSQSDNPVGTYTDTAKASIQHMLGTDTNFANYESDTTADQAYAIGELFMLNGKLHQATAAIAIGDTFTVGTNCAVVNVAEVFPHDVQVDGTSVMSNGVANVQVASASDPGVVKVSNTYGLDIGTSGQHVDFIRIVPAPTNRIKGGDGYYNPVTTNIQHASTFYGLAKAAGADMKDIANTTVGTYPEAQKSAISEMLNGSVSVSGSTPTIPALPGVQYVCGEVSTLAIEIPASGCFDVVFESGSTATVLGFTLPTAEYTLVWENGFDPTSLDANTTYEINIKIVGTKCLGVVGSWTR